MKAPPPPIRGSIEHVELTAASGRAQSLHVYLPPSYRAEADRRYPALYMHFGQHLFDPKHPGGDSWQLHRLVERLSAQGLVEEFVVVGIDAMRASGHTDAYHYANLIDGSPCTGMDYEALILGEVMPHVESRFRVLTGPAHTSMVGACGGAVLTYNVAARNPGVFGKIGLLSTVARSAGQGDWLLGSKDLRPKALCWIDAGGAEGFFTPHAREVADNLLASGARPGVDVFYLLEPDGIHGDASWGERMANPLLLFYGDVGKPVSAELRGGDTVGVGGVPLTLNPILEYDSGFRMTALDADYEVADPAVLRVGRDGRVSGLSEGSTEVKFRADGVEAARTIRVSPGLPEQVPLTLRARVIEDRPALALIYFSHLGLTRGADGVYEGSFSLPRGYALSDRFSCGMRKFELRFDGSPAPLRHIRADADATLAFTVERWPDLDAASGKGSAD